jgi:hypothetical protein
MRLQVNAIFHRLLLGRSNVFFDYFQVKPVSSSTTFRLRQFLTDYFQVKVISSSTTFRSKLFHRLVHTKGISSCTRNLSILHTTIVLLSSKIAGNSYNSYFFIYIYIYIYIYICAGSSGAVHSVFLINAYLDLENPGGSGFWVGENRRVTGGAERVSLRATGSRGGRVLTQKEGSK